MHTIDTRDSLPFAEPMRPRTGRRVRRRDLKEN